MGKPDPIKINRNVPLRETKTAHCRRETCRDVAHHRGSFGYRYLCHDCYTDMGGEDGG